MSPPQTATVVEADNLICQAIINSGIALETEATEAAEQAEARSPKAVLQAPETDARLTEIQVTEECVETMAEETQVSFLKSNKANLGINFTCHSASTCTTQQGQEEAA